jgi:orotidine-5'-phosphate decarboxylase
MAASVARSYSDSDSADAKRNRTQIAREKLIVALDLPTLAEAANMVATLGDEVVFYKVGLGLQLAGGDKFAKDLIGLGKKVFLDYKYYDIPNTVENAVARAAAIGVNFLTVHGVTEIMKSAVVGRGQSAMKILCVTVLTSMDGNDLAELGVKSDVSVEDLVVRRATKALDAGVDGVIASAHEVAAIKAKTNNKLMVVTPGIRPDNAATGDQKRIATPGAAIKAGADYLVVGRPIWADVDPRRAARDIIGEISEALP